ncbi:MAG: hypothetical protein PHF64_09125 [Methanoregula sp.]|nr:hypothetical protein [Methanoregula sp.]
MKNRRTDRQCFMFLAFLVIALIATSACVTTSPKATGMYSAPTIPATTIPFTNQQVDILNQSRGITSTGDMYVGGVVKSRMSRPLTAWININVHGKNNTTLGTGETMVRLDMLGVSEFRVILENSSSYAQDDGISFDCYVNRVNY